jgi:uncharacterized oxidoreductase
MNMNNAHVLITGGSDGIGKGLAARFLASGSRVVITGRNAKKLEAVKLELPGLEVFVSDIGKQDDRISLAQYIAEKMPDLNILINNAGIQRRIALAADHSPWEEREEEIHILLSGPIHLNHLLIPILLENKKQSTVVNVTSGGAYIPQGFAPVYSACKAALHSYTVTLRDSLAETPCKVIELIPPAVQTGLAGTGSNHGASLNEYCDAVFNELQFGANDEIGFGPTKNIQPELSGQPVAELFKKSNSRFAIEKYRVDDYDI